METNKRIFRLVLRSDRPIVATADGVRGYFGAQFPNETLLHQHLPGTTRTVYQYPLVQYRVDEESIKVIGVDAGAAALGRVYDRFESIRLGATVYPVIERQGEIRTEPFGLVDEETRYRFVTPWVPLSQKNHLAFSNLASRQEQTAFLERILIGNLLSASKSLGYTVPGRIVVALTDWHRIPCDVKGTSVMGVNGEFRVNFAIPDGLGVGRSVSRGNGAVQR